MASKRNYPHHIGAERRRLEGRRLADSHSALFSLSSSINPSFPFTAAVCFHCTFAKLVITVAQTNLTATACEPRDTPAEATQTNSLLSSA